MELINVLFISLTDDPLDPPGAGRYGGSHVFALELGRYLLRRGHSLTYLTRKSRPNKPDYQQLGPNCGIVRIDCGPPGEVIHHQMAQFKEAAIEETLRFVAKADKTFTSVLSYNWISGLAALETGIHPHIHLILSLGRARIERRENVESWEDDRDLNELKVFANSDLLVCACRDEQKALHRLYPEVQSKRTQIIEYGVDDDIFQRRPVCADTYLRREARRLA